MLKRKKELNYRKGLTWKYCGTCLEFVERFEGVGSGVPLTQMSRCRKIGLQPGRQYRIIENNICDGHNPNPKFHRGGFEWTK